jgi:hypothetical protein
MLIGVLLEEHANGLGVRVLGECCVSLGGLRRFCYSPRETPYRLRDLLGLSADRLRLSRGRRLVQEY